MNTVTVPEFLAIIADKPVGEILAFLDKFALEHPDAEAAVAAAKKIVQVSADVIPLAATAGIADVVQQLKDGFGISNPDIGMSL